MTFARRQIDVRFQLGEGAFGESGFDTVDVTGLRVSASIVKAGGVSMSYLQMRVYGLDLSTMNRLSTLGKPLVDGRNNTVTVTAGDDVSGKAIVFSGIINNAWTDGRAAPEMMFNVEAFTGLLDSYRPLPPTSFPGSADAAVIVAGLAAQMGYAFENGGVNVQLANPYFAGTGRAQLESVARAGNFNFFVDDTLGAVPTLAIWPKDGVRNGLTPLVSAETGMIGYPAHTQNGISVTTVYNPNIVFGRQIEIRSSLTPAQGQWAVYSVRHELESETPGGQWTTTAECTVLGRVVLG